MSQEDLKVLIEAIVLQELGDITQVPRQFTGLVAFVNAYNDVKDLLGSAAPTINLEYDPKYYGGEIQYTNGRAVIGPNIYPPNMFAQFGHDLIHALTVNLAKHFTSKKNQVSKQPKSLLLKNIELVSQRNNVDILKHLGFKGHNFTPKEFQDKLKTSDLPDNIKKEPLFRISKTHWMQAVMPGTIPHEVYVNADKDEVQHMAEEIFGNAIMDRIKGEVIASEPISKWSIFSWLNQAMYNLYNTIGAKSSFLPSNSDYAQELRPQLIKLGQKHVGSGNYRGDEDGKTPEEIRKSTQDVLNSGLGQFVERYNEHLKRLSKVKFRDN